MKYFNSFMCRDYIDEYMAPKWIEYKYKKEIEDLYAGCYRGIVFQIQWVGGWPCCYIKVPYFLSDILTVNSRTCSDYVNINCHGGCTYEKDDGNGMILGWDYAHAGDAAAFTERLCDHGKKYNLFELVRDVCDCIDDIFDDAFDNK